MDKGTGPNQTVLAVPQASSGWDRSASCRGGRRGGKGHGCVRCSCVRSWLDSETASHFPSYALCNLKECLSCEAVLPEPSDRQECDKYYNIWNQKILGSGVGNRECRGCGNFLVIWNVLSDRKCPKLPPNPTLLSRACFCLTLVIYTLLLTKLSEFKTKRNIKGSPFHSTCDMEGM